MLLQIRPRRTDDAAAPDGVDLLLECHARIRAHLALARTLAAGVDAPPAEVSATAARVRRYFAEALPLHVEDEDETVRAFVGGRTPEIDAALSRMSGEHVAHAPALTALVALCTALERTPERHARVAPELAAAVATLEADLLDHLAHEETVIVPALRALPAAARLELAAAIRARRLHPARTTPRT